MNRTALLLLLLAGLVVLGIASTQVSLGSAQEPLPTPTATPAGNPHETGDCLACHTKPGMTTKFADGEVISITYDPQQHTSQIHTGLNCVACHENQRKYPHVKSTNDGCTLCHWQISGNAQPPATLAFDNTYQDPRALTLEISQACGKCHGDMAQAVSDSAHARVMADGNRYAPVCVDCHGSHDITPVTGAPRSLIPQICSKCHLAEYTTYLTSVHGAALLDNGNPDVPTCGDCHGIHKISGPSDASFRADSIEVCGKCHSNKALMDKYGISTAVLTTYLDDFHGRTVNFFRLTGETQVTKATCYDCHGIHNIRKPDDPLSQVYPTNLQKTCGQCHTDANIRFPQAWLGHQIPTAQKMPVLFAVNTIYSVFIPLVIGGFGVYILLDARRRLATWFRNLLRPKNRLQPETPADKQSPGH